MMLLEIIDARMGMNLSRLRSNHGIIYRCPKRYIDCRRKVDYRRIENVQIGGD